jgi:5'-phosphate synthase pdxT subunit
MKDPAAFSRLTVGVLALQGDVVEHVHMLRQLGARAVEVRQKQHLKGLHGLIIPGGESTTIGQLAHDYGLIAPMRRFALKKPVWGTCAGMIFLAKSIGADQPILGVMDIVVQRNAFGRQLDSFTEDIVVTPFRERGHKPFPAVFIRAPKIVGVNGRATVIARLKNKTAVAAREGRWLATAFHPELTNDFRFHRYFLEMIARD